MLDTFHHVMQTDDKNEQYFPFIEVSGNSYEMGFQHGEQARNLIQKYLLLIERLTGMSRDNLVSNAGGLLKYIEDLSPNLGQEIMGLADGAKISIDEAVLCQARAEAARSWDGGCTAFAIRGDATLDGNPLAGQNQDLQSEYSDVSIILKVSPTDGRPRAIMFTFAGQLGYSGMNEHGISHFANALYGFEWRVGLPHYPLKRLMLEQSTIEECINLYKTHKVCSAANVILCGPNGDIADIEVRPDGVAEYVGARPDCRLHTNHYVTPEFEAFETNHLPDSPQRLDKMRQVIYSGWGKITVDYLKDMLANHEGYPSGICRHGSENLESISGYIAEPAQKRLHIRYGHGCNGTWTVYTL